MSQPPLPELEFQAAAGEITAQLTIARVLLEQGETERGRDWLRRAAASGSIDAQFALGSELLSQEPYDVVEGIGWAQAAAGHGSGDAEHLLAMATAEGLGVGQDVERALDHLARSAELGCTLARSELLALAGDWSPPDTADRAQSRCDWKALRASIPVADWLRTPPVKLVSAAPRIGVVERFASPQICRWLTARAAAFLTPAQTIDSKTGKGRYDESVRTNSNASFDIAHRDMILVMLRARISRLIELPVSGFEDTQVLHYAPGEEFKPHFDFFNPARPGHAAAVASGGQRMVTFLAYLNEGYEGGDTLFPALGWSYKGRTGDALFFYNATPDGTPDRRTLHAGSPLSRGEKWLLSQWIRHRL